MRNGNFARLRRMLELAVTASHVVHVPYVGAEDPDHLRASHRVYHTHSLPMESSWKSANEAHLAKRYARIVALLPGVWHTPRLPLNVTVAAAALLGVKAHFTKLADLTER